MEKVIRGVYKVVVVVVVVVGGACGSSSSSSSSFCPSQEGGLFIFGDALSDVGNGYRSGSIILIPSIATPFGRTYPGSPSGRFSDGLVFPDFLVRSMGIDDVKPYLMQSADNNTDFSNGVNYAVTGATALGYLYLLSQGGVPLNAYSIDLQLSWHYDIIMKSTYGYMPNNYPNMHQYSSATYYIEFGGNDIYVLFDAQKNAEEIIQTHLPMMVAKVSSLIKILYEWGARNFYISNVGPQGCTAIYLNFEGHHPLDDNGCRADVNLVDHSYSILLQAQIETLKVVYPSASFTFLDLYSAYLEVVKNPTNYGIRDTLDSCCGLNNISAHNFRTVDYCNPESYVCSSPNTFLTWDGIHPTHNLNRIIFNLYASGRFIDPPTAFSSCNATLVPLTASSKNKFN